MSFAEQIYISSPPLIQSALVSTYGLYRRWRFRYSSSYRQAWNTLNALEQSSRSRIRSYQERLLRRVVRHAYQNIPYYRALLRERGFHPDDNNMLERLRSLPILDKSEVQDNWNAFQDWSVAGPVMESKTSGTTGTGLRLRLSEEVVGFERAAIDRYRGRAGYTDGDRVASFTGRRLMHPDKMSPPFWRYNWADRQMLFSYWHVSDNTLPEYIRAYNNFAPSYAHGYPSFLYLIAEFCLREDRVLYSPEAIFTSSETLHEWQRKTIERAFGASILDRYASAEKIVSAAQCEEGSYHVDGELGILEIIDGEVVATTLHNLAMPLIRYRIGDAVEWDENYCSCGRSLPVINQPQGRVEDILVAPDGRKFGRLDHLFKTKTEIREAQIIQNRIDQITVRVVRVSRNSISQEEIKRVMRKNLGEIFSINVEFVDEIPREENGKFRFVKSKVSREGANSYKV